MRAKEELRAAVREERARIRPSVLVRKSREALARLTALDEYRAARNVMAYVSLREEPETRAFLREAEKRLLLPFLDGGVMKAAPFTGELVPGRYALEPAAKEAEEEIDLVIVPGIAFDERGYRLGYGKGYYDAFLAGRAAVKVGLAFEELLVNRIPEEAHDVPMDLIVTEQRVIRCAHG